ncbi:MAG: OmpH family outer membrane protein [Candidatus Symbiothrix sp.]|jgi:outer membrane protein|nr:OmpH family outer membrane protein [Candidatus Symbiothrix sp.]
MYKKFVLFILVLFPVAIFAQEVQRIAHVNYGEVVMAMPEYALMQDSLKKQEEAFVTELKILQEDWVKKSNDFAEQQDKLNESIKTRRTQELYELQSRMQDFEQYAREQQEKLSQALLAPILEKFQKIIGEVAVENHFTYVLNASGILYSSPQGLDATPLVRKKLGLK